MDGGREREGELLKEKGREEGWKEVGWRKGERGGAS